MNDLLFHKPYVELLKRSLPHLSIDTFANGAPFFHTGINLFEALNRPLMKSIAHRMGKLDQHLVFPTTTIMGLPFEPYEQTAVLHRLPSIQTMIALARNRGSQLLAITNIVPGDHWRKHLCEMGFVPFNSFPEMSINLPPSGFMDLIGSLHKKRRQDIRRNIRRFEMQGHLLHFNDAKNYVWEICDAYHHCYDRAKFKWIKLAPDYFFDFASLGSIAKTIVATTHTKKFLGFISLLNFAGVTHLTRIAIHPRFLRQDGIYFRLIYKALQVACENKSQRVSLGPTTYRIKKNLGARRRTTYNFVLPISRRWKIIFATLKPLMSRELKYLEHQKLLEENY